MTFSHHPILLTIISAVLLSSCGNQEGAGPDTDVISTTQLKLIESESELEAYLKNGLKLVNNLSGNRIEAHVLTAEDTTTNIAASADSALSDNSRSLSSAPFSTTNTQEAQVDEADRIEYDGEFLYVLTHSDNYWYIDSGFNVVNPVLGAPVSAEVDSAMSVSPLLPPTDVSPPGVRVMQRGDNSSMNEIAWLHIDNINGFDGLYLTGDVLAALSMTYGPVNRLEMDRVLWYWGRPQTRLDLMDVSVPAEIHNTHTIVLDGHLVSSRRVDNYLTLITQYTPDLPGFIPYPLTEDQQLENQDLIDSTSLDNLLPTISVNGNVSPMLLAEKCYIQKDSHENSGYANLTVVSIINLDAPDEINSRCFNAPSHGIYVSPQSLYITSAQDNSKTDVYKFSIDNGRPLFKGSGTVPGNLGWRHPAYRMSESGDNLRVVSTLRNDARDLEHYLTVLQDDQQGKLLQLSQIPNNDQPEKIGKPGEDIQSVRYFQDRAYVVTFLQIDPLYVIDLSNPNAPIILGDLEIPGFSAYLHPVNENLLLGFGQESWGDSKMSLFDVSNPQEPLEIQNFIWPKTSTPLRWDPHALSFLEMEKDHYRFAFPVERWGDYNSVSALYMFDLMVKDNQIELPMPSVLPVTIDNRPGYAYGYNQRSVIHGNEVHYVHDHRVWSATWDLSVIHPQQ